MSNKKITAQIIFNTCDGYNPSQVKLSFSKKDIERIRHLQDLANEEDVVIRMDFSADKLIGDQDWRPGYECISIGGHERLYYFAQNKYDSTLQIESEHFII